MARRVQRRTMQGQRERVRRKHGARPPITQPGSCARGLASARTYRWARPVAGSVGNRIRPHQGRALLGVQSGYSPECVEGVFSAVPWREGGRGA
jgi:hypothetical protein